MVLHAWREGTHRDEFLLHHHPSAERPDPQEKEYNDGDTQSQDDPGHSKRRKGMPEKTGDHCKSQSLSGIGEWIEERYNLEPSDRVKCAPWIICTTRKNQWREDQGEHQANLFWFDQRAYCQA